MTPGRPTVAVVMATYQGADYVAAQLETILQQSRRPDSLFIRDDVSTDGTPGVVQRVLAGASVPASFACNPERLGARLNFAALLAEQDADIVLLADQDDLWRPDKVRTLLAQLEAVPEAGAAFSDGGLIDAAGTRLPGGLFSRTGFARGVRQQWCRDAFGVLLRRTVAPGATMAVRRSLLQAALPMSPHGWHDHWLLLVAAALGPVVVVEDPLIDYRLHASNAVGLVPPRRIAQLRQRTTVPRGRARVGRREEALFFADLADRLDAAGARTAAARARAASEHALRRLALPRALYRRAGVVGRHALAGEYRRYSNGLQSVVGDLLDR